MFQAFNLIPTLTAAGEHHPAARPRRTRSPTQAWLDQVDRHRRPRRPPQPPAVASCPVVSSSGSRSHGHSPAGHEIIFADEPTGNLDSAAGAEILDFMQSAVRDLDQTIVMVTHDPVAAGYADTCRVPRRRPHRRQDGRSDGRQGARPAEGPRGLSRCSSSRSRTSLAHKRRLASTFLAVVLGVAFLAGNLVLTDTITKTFDDLFADVFRRHGRRRAQRDDDRG